MSCAVPALQPTRLSWRLWPPTPPQSFQTCLRPPRLGQMGCAPRASQQPTHPQPTTRPWSTARAGTCSASRSRWGQLTPALHAGAWANRIQKHNLLGRVSVGCQIYTCCLKHCLLPAAPCFSVARAFDMPQCWLLGLYRPPCWHVAHFSMPHTGSNFPQHFI